MAAFRPSVRIASLAFTAAVVLTEAIALPQLASAQQSRSQSQTQTATQVPLSSGCRYNRDFYTCDRGKFQVVLAAAKTAAIETGPVDPSAQEQLEKLIAKLGKTVAPRGEADLTFLLIPIDPQSVTFSTGSQPIATLRIFAKDTSPGATPGRGNLVWAENYTGPLDLPWFAVVNNVIAQFKSRFKIK